MKFKLGCNLFYQVSQETVFIFNFEVARLQSHINLTENLTFTPNLARRVYMTHDTRNRYVSVLAPPGALSLSYQAEVELSVLRAAPEAIPEMNIWDLPLNVLPYLLPSRFVPSDRLAAFARREFAGLARGHLRVSAICNWIYENIEYRRGSSDAETTATEILIRRAGVCRDFAHLGIAFCRALGIPARFVTCYAYGLAPPDFHAVFEAYLAGRWWLFDPTRQAVLDGLIRIGVGRDAAEVAFATPFGLMQPGPLEIWIERTDSPYQPEVRTVDAISTEEPSAEMDTGTVSP